MGSKKRILCSDWLPVRVCKMGPSCPLEIARFGPVQKRKLLAANLQKGSLFLDIVSYGIAKRGGGKSK